MWELWKIKASRWERNVTSSSPFSDPISQSVPLSSWNFLSSVNLMVRVMNTVWINSCHTLSLHWHLSAHCPREWLNLWLYLSIWEKRYIFFFFFMGEGNFFIYISLTWELRDNYFVTSFSSTSVNYELFVNKACQPQESPYTGRYRAVKLSLPSVWGC